MEEILTFELITGSVIPPLGLLIVLAGYVVTDKLFLHETILFLDGKKERAVALAAIPLAVGYMATGSDWQSVLITYFSAVALYDLLLKYLLKWQTEKTR